MSACSLAAGSAAIVLGPGPAPAYRLTGLALTVLLAVACAVLVLRGLAPRAIFRLIMLGALLDVVLLALSRQRLLA